MNRTNGTDARLGDGWAAARSAPVRNASKLERLEIPAGSRVVKDWFETREKVEEVLPAILAHIKATGETHTCPFHTHTTPPENAPVVYIAEFAIPKKYRDMGRFCPCPCCWDEFPKFGVGRVAWFPEERVVRIIGEDCFEAISPDAHREATALFEEERKRRKNTNFLLANLSSVPDVVRRIESALIVARAIEHTHELLHDRLKMVSHRLWPYVMRGGELVVSVRTREFRREENNEVEVKDSEMNTVFAVLPGYEMLNPKRPRLSNVLERALERIQPYHFERHWRPRIAVMTDSEKEEAADILSRAIRGAMDIITRCEKLRKFAERVSINTLRAWGQERGCPVPFNYQHTGDFILLGPNDANMVGFPVSPQLRSDLRQIDFWIPMNQKDSREL